MNTTLLGDMLSINVKMYLLYNVGKVMYSKCDIRDRVRCKHIGDMVVYTIISDVGKPASVHCLTLGLGVCPGIVGT